MALSLVKSFKHSKLYYNLTYQIDSATTSAWQDRLISVIK